MRKLYAVTFVVLLFFTFAATPGGAESDKKPITANDLWAMKRCGSVAVSPDGKSVALVVTEYDVEDNSGNGDIWLTSIDEGNPRRFTTGESSEGSPQWSPDGSRLAFVAKRGDDEYSQIYVIHVGGGEARAVTDMPLGASAPRWLPDGRRIVFASRMIPGFETDLDSLRAEVKRRKESKVTARITENRFYRHWDKWLTDGYYPHFYLLDLETEEMTDLTPGYDKYWRAGWNADYDVSPDGEEIAFSAVAHPAPFDSLLWDVYLLKIDSPGETASITEDNPANDTAPRYSPDGKYILYGRQEIVGFYADRTRLTRYDRKTGEKVELAQRFDRSPRGWRFSPDSRTVYFTAQDKGGTSIFSTPMKGGPVVEVFSGGTSSNLEVAGSKTLVFLHEDLSHPAELYSVRTGGGRGSKLTSFNDEILDRVEMGIVYEHYFEGAGGDEVQMFVIYPPGFDHSKKWPLLHLVHGGPHGIFGDYFHYRWNAQLFAAPGYVTAMVNFHGSSSFGQDYTDVISGEWGDKPFTDIMKATDFLIDTGVIAESRMAVAGGSYGGYLVSWIGCKTDRFACIINHAGVFDLVNQFASDYTMGRERSFGGAPWTDLEGLLRWSPAHNVENYVTPTLIIHGEKDYRVPIGQGLEAYGILKGKGVDAKLVYFPDENHWVLSPQNSIFWYNEFHAWLDKHIGEEATVKGRRRTE